jgi:hypothetical protein
MSEAMHSKGNTIKYILSASSPGPCLSSLPFFKTLKSPSIRFSHIESYHLTPENHSIFSVFTAPARFRASALLVARAIKDK